jgi:hypothetical protein
MKKTLALASIVLMAGSLSACGGDNNNSSSGGSYCDQIKDVKASTDGLDFTTLSSAQFADFKSSLRDVESAAPDDVKGDWKTFNDTLDEVSQILDDAGLSFDDLQAISKDPTNLPDGVDIAKLQEFAQKMQALDTRSEFEDASNAIQASVKDQCGIVLDETSSPSGS